MSSFHPGSLFASGYADGFIEYWTRAFRTTDGVVLFAVGIGILCISIILFGGKWKK
jgi:hypothetical protein